jgi:hypothetical protein
MVKGILDIFESDEDIVDEVVTQQPPEIPKYDLSKVVNDVDDGGSVIGVTAQQSASVAKARSPLDELIAKSGEETSTGFKVNAPIQVKEERKLKSVGDFERERSSEAFDREGRHLDDITLMMRGSLKRLGLGEGDFVDEEQVDPVTGAVRTMPAAAIFGHIMVMGPTWSEEELDEYVAAHYVEGRKIGNVLYPKEAIEEYDSATEQDYVEPVNAPVDVKRDVATPAHQPQSNVSAPKIDTRQEYEPSVSIVIDKQDTDEISFTEDEQDKIEKATKIILNVVSKEDIFAGKKIIRAKDADPSLLKAVDHVAGRLPCNLAASRYHCEVSGLSYVELNDIGTNADATVLSNENKIWSIIYKHVHNPSIGPFADYNDFLKKTAYTDANLLVYYMLCATLSDIEDVEVTCRNPVWKKYNTFKGKIELKQQVGVVGSAMEVPQLLSSLSGEQLTVGNYILVQPSIEGVVRERYVIVYKDDPGAWEAVPYQVYQLCGTTYHHKYDPKTLIDVTKYSEDVLAQFSVVQSATSVEEALSTYDEGLVASHNMFTLPESKYVCEIGLKSAYDALVKFNSYLVGDRLIRRYYRMAISEIKHNDQDYEVIFRHSLPDNPDHLTESQKDIVDEYISNTGMFKDIKSIGLLTAVVAVYVPSAEGYVMFDDPEQLVDIFKKLSHRDYAMLDGLAIGLEGAYKPEGLFGYRNCECPKCHNKLDIIPVDDIKKLVFLATRSLVTTDVDVSNLLKV